MNGQTDRPEYLCTCFRIWYDPEDAEKTVNNMTAHFFNTRKATWAKEKGAGPPDAEEYGKGTHQQEEWGNHGWGSQQEKGTGYHEGKSTHKKEEWGNQSWAAQQESDAGYPEKTDEHGKGIR